MTTSIVTFFTKERMPRITINQYHPIRYGFIIEDCLINRKLKFKYLTSDLNHTPEEYSIHINDTDEKIKYSVGIIKNEMTNKIKVDFTKDYKENYSFEISADFSKENELIKIREDMMNCPWVYCLYHYIDDILIDFGNCLNYEKESDYFYVNSPWFTWFLSYKELKRQFN